MAGHGCFRIDPADSILLADNLENMPMHYVHQEAEQRMEPTPVERLVLGTRC